MQACFTQIVTQLPCTTCSPHQPPGLRLPPSPSALQRYPAGKYAVSGDESKLPASPMAIMLRSHQLKVEEVPPTVRAIVRCGAGVNNIPVPKVGGAGSVGMPFVWSRLCVPGALEDNRAIPQSHSMTQHLVWHQNLMTTPAPLHLSCSLDD